MLGIGWSELLILAIIGLIFVGPKQLPELLRGVAKLMATLSKAKDEWTSAIREDKSLQDIQRSMNEVRDSVYRSGLNVKKTVDQDWNRFQDEVSKLDPSESDKVPEHEDPHDEATETYHPGEEPHKK